MSHLFKVTDIQTRTDAYTHAHIITHNMQKCLLPACACVRVYGRRHVYVNINPAGAVFKCQTFNLFEFDLRWHVSRRPSRARRRDTDLKEKIIKDVKIKIKYQHSILLSAAEQIEVSCRERRESVPVQVVNRR